MVEKIIFARFFKTVAGNEPVREWLKNQTKDNKKIIGGDISAVEWKWPVGYPLVSKLDNDLWEVRTHLPERVIALQMQESLNREHLTKTELAARLETSCAAVDRLLDPYNESITLLTLKKAAAIMGKKIKLELV
jgi:hypothetical protein